GDYYHFDPIQHRLTGERSGRSFRLGDSVEVKVMRVDLDERKIEFEMSEQQLSKPVTRKPQGTQSGRAREERRERDAKPSGRGKPGARDGAPRKRAAEKVDLDAPTDVRKSRAVKQELLSAAKGSKGA